MEEIPTKRGGSNEAERRSIDDYLGHKKKKGQLLLLFN